MMRTILLLFLWLASIVGAGAQTNDTCDFSSFHPIQESDFVRKNATVRVRPTYPTDAPGLRTTTTVRVHILVARTGDVLKACPLDEDNSTSQDAVFVKAAIDAAKQWKFRKNFGYRLPPRSDYRDAVLAFRFERVKQKASVH